MNTLFNKYLPVYAAENETGAEAPVIEGEGTPSLITGEPETPSAGEPSSPEEPSGAAADEEEKSEDVVEPLTAESFAMPEGMEVAEEQMTEFLDTLNNKDLSAAERGQKLLDMQAKLMQDAHTQGIEQFNETVRGWQNELLEDKTFGGEAFEANISEMNQFLRPYMDDDFAEAMASTGAGSHPAVVKTLSKIAKTFGEGQPVKGTPAAETAQRSQADRVFPNHKKD